MKSDKRTKGLVPKLRFPEFRDGGSWERKTLDKIFNFLRTANNSRADLSGSGDIYYIHYGDIHTKFHTYVDFAKDNIPMIKRELCKNATPLENGDLIIADASEDKEGIAKSVEVKNLRDFEQAISGLHTVLLREKEKVYVNGFKGLLSESYFVKEQLLRLAVGVKVYSVSKTILSKCILPIPSLTEQQRIADCLSSIDELIKLHSQKLELLKDYKKGLMQQLFPAEGKAIPKLRFSEFKNISEWKEKKLSDIAQPIKTRNRELANSDVLTLSSEKGLIKQEEYFERKIIGNDVQRYIHIKQNDFVYNDRITKLFIYGTIKRLSSCKEGIVSPIYKCFRLNAKQNPIFWEYYFESGSHECQLRGLVNEGARQGRYNISIEKFLSIDVYGADITEQQKIAGCLSSIDELITSQTRKIESLREHKKGLMQQLFPSSEEVS